MEKAKMLVEEIRKNIEDGKSGEEIFQSLRPLLGKESEFEGQLAESLATLPYVETAKILQSMLEISSKKTVQKIIRRSLYRLKSKGISTEEVPFKKETSILRPLQAEPPKGMGGGFDSSGHRFLLLVIPHTRRGGTVMEGVISDALGLVNFSGEEVTRKGVRIFLEEIRKSGPSPLVDIDASYVGFLFVQAHQITLEKRGPVPQDYLRFKGEIESVKKKYEKPLVYSYLQADEIAAEDWMLQRGGDLLKADLFAGWRIEENLIRSYADEVTEAEESKIVLHPTQKEARFQGIYQRALSELFSGDRRFLYKRRLEEMAYVLFKLGREEEARISLAVALDLEKPLNLIQPNPFLFQLVVTSILSLLAEAYDKRGKEPSLIVKP
jgi:hypothetical protein